MEMTSLLIEQRDTADKYRAVEKDVHRQQQILGAREVDAAGRRQAEEALSFGQAEMLRLGKLMLDLDASVTIAAAALNRSFGKSSTGRDDPLGVGT